MASTVERRCSATRIQKNSCVSQRIRRTVDVARERLRVQEIHAQTPSVRTAQDLRSEFEGSGLACVRRRSAPAVIHDRCSERTFFEHTQPFTGLPGEGRQRGGGRLGFARGARQRGEVTIDQRAHGGFVESTYDAHDGVVGRIVVRDEGFGLGVFGSCYLLSKALRRVFVRPIALKHQFVQAYDAALVRVLCEAHPMLVEKQSPLALERLFVERQLTHAIGFQPKYQPKFGWDALGAITRHFLGRKGVTDGRSFGEQTTVFVGLDVA